MHKLQDIQHLLLMFITSINSLASVKMAGLPDLFLFKTDPHSRNWVIILIIVELLGTAESRYFRRNSSSSCA
jgi:glycerol-3-phosphate dehydrogenase